MAAFVYKPGKRNPGGESCDKRGFKITLNKIRGIETQGKWFLIVNLHYQVYFFVLCDGAGQQKYILIFFSKHFIEICSWCEAAAKSKFPVDTGKKTFKEKCSQSLFFQNKSALCRLLNNSAFIFHLSGFVWCIYLFILDCGENRSRPQWWYAVF